MSFIVAFATLFILVFHRSLANHYLTIPNKCYPCYDENYDISKYVDVSNIELIHTDEGTELHGHLIWKHRFNTLDLLRGKVTVEKQVDGEWVLTTISITRDDLCKTVFNPNEIWYNIIKDLPEDEKSCPPKVGSRLDFDHKSTTMENDDPINDMEGYYRVTVNLTSMNMELCFMVECDHIMV